MQSGQVLLSRLRLCTFPEKQLGVQPSLNWTELLVDSSQGLQFAMDSGFLNLRLWSN